MLVNYKSICLWLIDYTFIVLSKISLNIFYKYTFVKRKVVKVLQWKTARQVIKVWKHFSAIDFKKTCDVYSLLFSWNHSL